MVFIFIKKIRRDGEWFLELIRELCLCFYIYNFLFVSFGYFVMKFFLVNIKLNEVLKINWDKYLKRKKVFWFVLDYSENL